MHKHIHSRNQSDSSNRQHTLQNISGKYSSFQNTSGKHLLETSFNRLEHRIDQHQKRIDQVLAKRNQDTLSELDTQINQLQAVVDQLEFEIGQNSHITELEHQKMALLDSRNRTLKTAFQNSLDLVAKQQQLKALQDQNLHADQELRFYLNLMRKLDRQEQHTLQLVADYRRLEQEVESTVQPDSEQRKSAHFFITQVS